MNYAVVLILFILACAAIIVLDFVKTKRKESIGFNLFAMLIWIFLGTLLWLLCNIFTERWSWIIPAAFYIWVITMAVIPEKDTV